MGVFLLFLCIPEIANVRLKEGSMWKYYNYAASNIKGKCLAL